MNKVELAISGLIFIIGLEVSVLIILAFTGIHIQTTENGTHTGIVTAVETNGIFFKTNTVYFKSDAQSSQEEKYCVKDNALKNKLITLQKSKAKITIQYIDYIMYSITECSFENIQGIITGVEND